MADSLEDCKNRCRTHKANDKYSKDCTAINYKGAPFNRGTCELRACPIPVKPPESTRSVPQYGSDLFGWNGYYLSGGK